MPTRHAFSLLMACILITVALVGAAETHTPRFTITAEGDGNKLTVSAAGETVIMDVHSRSGIGSATAELVSGTLPENILLRLHLAGLEPGRVGTAHLIRLSVVFALPAGSFWPGYDDSAGRARPTSQPKRGQMYFLL